MQRFTVKGISPSYIVSTVVLNINGLGLVLQ